MGLGGYFKGEKKKPKKDKTAKNITNNYSSFSMPEIVSKKKKDY